MKYSTIEQTLNRMATLLHWADRHEVQHALNHCLRCVADEQMSTPMKQAYRAQAKLLRAQLKQFGSTPKRVSEREGQGSCVACSGICECDETLCEVCRVDIPATRKVIGDATCLEALAMLDEGECSTSEIHYNFSFPYTATSDVLNAGRYIQLIKGVRA